MTFRICLILLISVFWLCSAETNDTVFSTFIEKSASLARISATIAIHNGIFAKNSTVQEVTSEFLEISPSVAKELLEHDYYSLSSSMKKFHSSLSKISPEMKNGDELIETLNFLLDMKVNQKYLKPGTLGDQTEHFSRTAEIMKNSHTDGNKMMYTPDLITTVELLRNVTKSDGQAMKKDEIEDILTDLADYLTLVGSQLNKIMTYKTVLKDYLSLESLSNDLQNVVNAARIARKYGEIIKKLDPFREDLIAVSKGMDEVEEVIKENQNSFEQIQNLFSTSIVLNSTVQKYEEKVLTRGLLGHKDLMMFGQDFENPWFQKNVLSDMDPAKLKNGLENLKPFVDALETLKSIEKPLFVNSTEKNIILDLIKKIGDFDKLGSKVLNNTNIKSTFEEVSTCIAPLQPIENPQDQAMLLRVVNFSEKVVKNVKKFAKLMDDLNKNGLESIIAVSKEIRENIEFVTMTKNDSLKIEMWNKAHKLEEDHKLADKLQSIADMLNDVRRRSFFLEDRRIDYTVIRKVSTLFEGTNVDSVLNCIQKQTLENIIETLEFIKKTHVLRERDFEVSFLL
ncbi:hypothetical protein B9Z55_003262 [Caenorhabditis nigoni]|uniref:Domain of unknown function WSN domain-containing protein n=1 Tax=Caenorhabditis nigoni TaxID=1611254 RepID=A0A2G5VPQ0_9PELO|nr:hypothetical protein B9Z55_003262 [Caenorhabditis nigoni]